MKDPLNNGNLLRAIEIDLLDLEDVGFALPSEAIKYAPLRRRKNDVQTEETLKRRRQKAAKHLLKEKSPLLKPIHIQGIDPDWGKKRKAQKQVKKTIPEKEVKISSARARRSVDQWEPTRLRKMKQYGGQGGIVEAFFARRR